MTELIDILRTILAPIPKAETDQQKIGAIIFFRGFLLAGLTAFIALSIILILKMLG